MTVIDVNILLYNYCSRTTFSNNVLPEISTNEPYSMPRRGPSEDGPSEDEQWEKILARLYTDHSEWDTLPADDQWVALNGYSAICRTHSAKVKYPMELADFYQRANAKFRNANCGYNHGTAQKTIDDARTESGLPTTAQMAEARAGATAKASQAKASQAKANLLPRLLKLHGLDADTTAADFKEYCQHNGISPTGL